MSNRDDENLRFCNDEQQIEHYKRLQEMGFHISDVCFGGTARIWRDGTTVEVPLTLEKDEYSFPQQVFRCIYRKGKEDGKYELRGKLKELLNIK